MLDARKIIEFLKKPSSKLVISTVVLFMIVVFIAPYMSEIFLVKKGVTKHQDLKEYEYETKSNIASWKSGVFNVIKPVKESEENVSDNKLENNKIEPEMDLMKAVSANPKPKPLYKEMNSNRREHIHIAVPLNIYNSEAVDKKELDKFLPYGRWIPCELVVTLQTSNSGTPIIGIVTADVFNDGKLIIPAGSEVHGTTAGMPVRDHIKTNDKWVIVWRTRDRDNGKELVVKGTALENGSKWNGKNWNLLDGSAGIKGFTHDTRNIAKLKDVAVGVVEGAGSGLQAAATLSAIAPPGVGAATEGVSGMSNIMGESLGGAISKGASKSASVLAGESMANIIESQYYVTAPAGTQFYLYVTQTINFNNAAVNAVNS